MLLGHILNSQGKGIQALGDNHWRQHRRLVVTQGNRIVVRVGDHHIGPFNGRHHAALGDLPLPLPQLGPNLGRAFHLFHLLLDFFAAHAHLTHEIKALKYRIAHRNQDQGNQQQQGTIKNQLACIHHRQIEILIHQRGDIAQQRNQIGHANAQDQKCF